MIFIFDRTQADVDLLKTLNAKINLVGWENLTVVEQEQWMSGAGEDLYAVEDQSVSVDGYELTVSSRYVRGALNYYDLNRIEENCLELQQWLDSYGYLCSVNVKTNWTIYDFLTLEDWNRIKQNVLNLVECYYLLPTSPEIDLLSLNADWTQANNVEETLSDISVLIERMIDGFLYCGTFYSGQEMVL